MNVEEQLRAYRDALDAATEDAATAHPQHTVSPIRVRPARTLIVAAVAVAAAIAIAFVAVGKADQRSTPPVGRTTTPPPSAIASPVTAPTLAVPNVLNEPQHDAIVELQAQGFEVVVRFTTCTAVSGAHVATQNPAAGTRAARGSSVAIAVCNAATETTLPVHVCPTEQGTAPGATDPHAPATVSVAPPTFASPNLAGYSGTRGYLIVTAPAGWNCRAIEAGDGGQGIGVTPPGSTPRDSWGNPGHVTTPLTDGVFGSSDAACQGCIYGEVCGIVPTAAADFPGFGSQTCPRPRGETVIDRGNGVYEFDDPAGTIGRDAARSLLRYVRPTAHSDASLASETCILPASERTVCDTLFSEFFALRPTPWTQTAFTITPTSLGAVTVGMDLFEAQEAAGLTFDGAGDGFHYPTKVPPGSLHLFVGFPTGGSRISCVGAEIFTTNRTPTQRVTTPEGFVLGDPVARLLAIYGTRATYVPAPPSGMTTNAGYVVKENGGALAFAVYRDKVFETAGGAADLTPNTCTG